MVDNMTIIQNDPSKVRDHLERDVQANNDFRKKWTDVLENSSHIRALHDNNITPENFTNWEKGWIYYFQTKPEQLYLSLETFQGLRVNGKEIDNEQFLSNYVVIFVANGISVDQNTSTVKIPIKNGTFLFQLEEDGTILVNKK